MLLAEMTEISDLKLFWKKSVAVRVGNKSKFCKMILGKIKEINPVILDKLKLM